MSLDYKPCVYAAGFDVFKPYAKELFVDMTDFALHLGITLLCPLSTATTSSDIFKANRKLLLSSHGMIANVNPFRGTEPDSGTAWEIGYFSGFYMPVVMYLDDIRSIKEKLPGIRPNGLAKDDMHVEDFNLPVNLMLAESGKIVKGDYKDALLELKEIFDSNYLKQKMILVGG